MAVLEDLGWTRAVAESGWEGSASPPPPMLPEPPADAAGGAETV